MTLEEALIIHRYGRTFGVFGTPARKKLREEAHDILKKRAEDLMAKAAPATLVDIQVYENLPPDRERLWVKRVFEDGSHTKVLEPRPFAQQIKYSFDAGLKAGAAMYRVPRYEDAR